MPIINASNILKGREIELFISQYFFVVSDLLNTGGKTREIEFH